MHFFFSNDVAAPDGRHAGLPGHRRLKLWPALLAGLVLFISLSIAYAVWSNAREAGHKKLEAEFDYRVRELAENIISRMRTYEQVLRATQGLLHGSIEVDREAFKYYVARLRLSERHPGIQGIAVSEIVPRQKLQDHEQAVRREGFPKYAVKPAGERDVYTSITHIEPFTEMNQRAFGFDMYSQAVRRAAMDEARDNGKPALSGRVVLVQEFEDKMQYGFLMYLPVYRLGAPLDTLEQRRKAILGWVYAPFRAVDFMAGLGGERSSELRVAIYDGEVKSKEACLYGCTASGLDSAVFKATKLINIVGHPWLLEVHSTPSFEERLDQNDPAWIAAAGVSISFLLATLVWLLAQGRARAVALALGMTQELRASSARIEAEEKRIRVILDNTHDAFVAIGADGMITDWNTQAERAFGWTAAETIGKNAVQLLIPVEQQDEAHARLARFLAGDHDAVRTLRIEAMAVHRDGRHFPIEVAVAAVKVENGYIANAFIRDISERKEAERRESQRQKALDQARTALLHAQKLEAVGKLTGGVAHDFNNVLQIISGNIELLQLLDGPAPDRGRLLEAAMSAVERGTKLSSQLLAFARRQPLEPRVVNLRRLLRNIDELVRQAVGESIDVEMIVGGGLWNTMVDPNQLENVILNLAINARDAMSNHGKLTLEIENAVLGDDYVSLFPGLHAGQYVLLAVSDIGSGMPPEVAERAFEPFFTTKPEGLGTGLGLSMAYGFVKQSGGHIRIYSEVGHGTTVKIYLPRSFAPEEDRPIGSAEQATGGNETILVVEDDREVRAAVVGILGDLGYKVLEAGDAQAGLAVLEQGHKVDLLFTDVVMPGPLRSTEMVRRAKMLQPGLAVLFTSGYTQNAIVHGGRLDPGVNLISKPYTRQQIARKIRQVLSGTDRSATDAGMADGSAQIREDTLAAGNTGAATDAMAEAPLHILVVEDVADLRHMAAQFLSVMGHCVTSARNAEEGMKTLETTRVDVLLTDVDLEGMNGIQLAEKALALQPDIEVIFATDHGDSLNGLSQKEPVILTKPFHLGQLARALMNATKAQDKARSTAHRNTGPATAA